MGRLFRVVATALGLLLLVGVCAATTSQAFAFCGPNCGPPPPAPHPTIKSLAPNFGGAGTVVTVTGSLLSGASVAVNGQPATVLSSSASGLTFAIPAGGNGSGKPVAEPVLVSSPINGSATSAFWLQPDSFVAGSGFVQNRNSGRCLGVSGGATTAGSATVQSDCYGNQPDQMWTWVGSVDGLMRLHNGSGECLSITAGSTTPGAPAVLAGCGAGTEQQWRVAGSGAPDYSYALVNVQSGLCLDVSGASVSNGAPLVQAACNGGVTQKWNGSIYFGHELNLNTNPSKCLGVLGASTSPGAQVVQWDCNTSADQAWAFQGDYGQSGQLFDANSGECLAISGESRATGATAVQAPCSGTPDQWWTELLRVPGENGVRYQNLNSGLCLGIASAATDNGAAAIQEPCDAGRADQHWVQDISYLGAPPIN
jgi:hypothetical protein